MTTQTAPRRNRVILPDLVAEGPVLPPPPGWTEYRLSGETMGTDWSLIAFAPPGSAPLLRALVMAECARVIALFSPWTPVSEVSALHRAPAEEVTISEEFHALLEPLLGIAAQSGGASDPTLGALVDLWGFGPPGARPATSPLPDVAEIARARAVSGAGRVCLQGRTLRRPPGMRFDFSGSAKGHAVDLVSAALSAAELGFHLIGIGGEYYARGLRPDMQPFWVGIEQPPGLTPLLVALNGRGLATSGDLRRGFTHDGRRYAHTIDPATGRPLGLDLSAVSVIADRVMQADALATALLVMGESRALDFARAEGIAAVLIRRDPGTRAGHVAVFTPAMERMMDDDQR